MPGIEDKLLRSLADAMPDAQRLYKQAVGNELDTQWHGQGQKIKGWVDSIKQSLISQPVYIEGKTVHGKVRIGDEQYVRMRARVLMHGNPGIGDPPHTKPDEQTWDDDLHGRISPDQKKSKVQRRMPQKFLHGPMLQSENGTPFMVQAGILTKDEIHDVFVNSMNKNIIDIFKLLSGKG